jgi:Retrotransposon gag protein
MEIVNVDEETDWVKYAVTLLTGKALTWWRGVANSPFYQLGVIDWDDFEKALKDQFSDVDRELRLRRKLHALR